jgi:hypothetical protein
MDASSFCNHDVITSIEPGQLTNQLTVDSKQLAVSLIKNQSIRIGRRESADEFEKYRRESEFFGENDTEFSCPLYA